MVEERREWANNTDLVTFWRKGFLSREQMDELDVILFGSEVMKKKKAVRQNFRDVCLKRDNYKCRVCGFKPDFDEELDVHHITDRTELANGGYVLENGISLCSKCHLEAEQFHTNGGTSWIHGLHPDDLYNLIGSSHEKAVKASERL